jgi:hypothetical protein
MERGRATFEELVLDFKWTLPVCRLYAADYRLAKHGVMGRYDIPENCLSFRCREEYNLCKLNGWLYAD